MIKVLIQSIENKLEKNKFIDYNFLKKLINQGYTMKDIMNVMELKGIEQKVMDICPHCNSTTGFYDEDSDDKYVTCKCCGEKFELTEFTHGVFTTYEDYSLCLNLDDIGDNE